MSGLCEKEILGFFVTCRHADYPILATVVIFAVCKVDCAIPHKCYYSIVLLDAGKISVSLLLHSKCALRISI